MSDAGRRDRARRSDRAIGVARVARTARSSTRWAACDKRSSVPGVVYGGIAGHRRRPVEGRRQRAGPCASAPATTTGRSSTSAISANCYVRLVAAPDASASTTPTTRGRARRQSRRRDRVARPDPAERPARAAHRSAHKMGTYADALALDQDRCAAPRARALGWHPFAPSVCRQRRAAVRRMAPRGANRVTLRPSCEQLPRQGQVRVSSSTAHFSRLSLGALPPSPRRADQSPRRTCDGLAGAGGRAQRQAARPTRPARPRR